MTITELLEENRIPFRRAGESQHVREGWCGVICPWCGQGSDKYGLGINLDSYACTCWKCGRHTLYDVLKALGIPYQLSKHCLGSRIRAETPETGIVGSFRPPKGLSPLDSPIARAARRYLASRGLDWQQMGKAWNLAYLPLLSYLAFRIYIPVRYQGKEVSWTTRAISDRANPRYIAAKPEDEAVPAKSILFGSDHVPGHSIIVVEGVFDTMAIGPGAVATFGISYTRSQLIAISKFPSRTICFDNDTGAQARARQLCQELSVYAGRTRLVEIEAKDPGCASKKEIRLLRKSFID